MTVQTLSGATATTFPQVNLLPGEIAEAAKFRRVQFAMGAAVVGAVAVVGLLYVQAHHHAVDAQNAVTAAHNQQTGLQSQVGALQSLSATYDQVAAHKAMLADAMGSEVRWSYYLEDLSLRIPDSVWLTSMTITQTDGPGASAAATSSAPVGNATPTSITPTGEIGTISFTGDALSKDDVAKWLTAIAAEHGWADPYVTNITEVTPGSKVVAWTGTVGVTNEALSNRYTQSGS